MTSSFLHLFKRPHRIGWAIALALSLGNAAWMPTQAWAAPHAHGQGQAELVLTGQTLTIELTLPMEVLVGFERAPRNDGERERVHQALEQLRQTHMLWQWPQAAQCQAQAAQTTTPQWQAAQHLDVTVTYAWTCQNPQALDRLQTRLFEVFKRLRRIDINHALPSGQGSSRLSPKKAEWNPGTRK